MVKIPFSEVVMFYSRESLVERIIPDVEKLISLKLGESNKHIMLAPALEEQNTEIFSLCTTLSGEAYTDASMLTDMLLKNRHNPTVRMNTVLSSMLAPREQSSKFISGILNLFISEKKRIAAYERRLMSANIISGLKNGHETINKIYLKDLGLIEMLSEMSTKCKKDL